MQNDSSLPFHFGDFSEGGTKKTLEKFLVFSMSNLRSPHKISIFLSIVGNLNLHVLHITNRHTLATLTGGEVKIVRPTLFTRATNHIRLAGTLSTISVTLIRIFGSNCATVARYIKK